jgi:hypothetical protein
LLQHQGLLSDERQLCLYFSLPLRKNKALKCFTNSIFGFFFKTTKFVAIFVHLKFNKKVLGMPPDSII